MAVSNLHARRGLPIRGRGSDTSSKSRGRAAETRPGVDCQRVRSTLLSDRHGGDFMDAAYRRFRHARCNRGDQLAGRIQSPQYPYGPVGNRLLYRRRDISVPVSPIAGNCKAWRRSTRCIAWFLTSAQRRRHQCADGNVQLRTLEPDTHSGDRIRHFARHACVRECCPPTRRQK